MRLTKKDKNGNYYTTGEDIKKAYPKLGQLEDILEKYEVDDLNVLEQVLENQRFLSNHDYSTLPREDFDCLFEKLDQYKNIENELGIDLITLFKALKNGIWLKDKKDQFIPYHCLLRDDFILVLYEDIYKEEYLLKDYGKTWTLIKEELL